jgi:hypothetical protein
MTYTILYYGLEKNLNFQMIKYSGSPKLFGYISEGNKTLVNFTEKFKKNGNKLN